MQGKNLEAGVDLLPPSFLTEPSPTCLRHGTAHNGLVSSASISNQENVLHAHRSSWKNYDKLCQGLSYSGQWLVVVDSKHVLWSYIARGQGGLSALGSPLPLIFPVPSPSPFSSPLSVSLSFSLLSPSLPFSLPSHLSRLLLCLIFLTLNVSIII